MRALVLGLGDSGLAMTRWLARNGWQVRVADTRAAPPRLEALRQEIRDAEFIAGPFGNALLDDVGLVGLSPGLSPTTSAAAPLIAAARKRKIEVVGEIELFARALAQLKAECGYAPRVIGITGTNGKTTTTRLTALLVERCGPSVGGGEHRAIGTRRTRAPARRQPATRCVGPRTVEFPAADHDQPDV